MSSVPNAVKPEDVKVAEPKAEEPKAEEPKVEEPKVEDVKVEVEEESVLVEGDCIEESDAMDCVVVEVEQGDVKLNVLVNLSSPTLAFSMEQLGDLCAAMKVLRSGAV